MTRFVPPKLLTLLKRHVPLIVGLLSITATFLATLQLDLATQQRDAMRFDVWVEKTHDNARERIYSYTNMLRGQRGLFTASREVTRHEFDRFVDSMDLPTRYPAVLGVGFALQTAPHQRDDVLRLLHEQDPTLDIWPALKPGNDLRMQCPTIYFRPTRPGYNNLLGFDVSATPVGRDAMHRSQQTLDAAASGDRLVIPPDHPVQATATASAADLPERQFALYLPVFRDDLFAGRPSGQNRDVVGYLYMIIDTDAYWHSIFHPLSQHYFDIYVYNGLVIKPATLEYANGSTANPRTPDRTPRYEQSVTVELAGRPWTLLFQSKPLFESISTRTAVVPLTFGVGLLASLVLFFLARSQTLAWMAAREANDELQHSEQQLRHVNETLEQRVAERTAVAERRATQIRRLAAEVVQIEQRERRRLARTLHDHLQQLLVAARLRLDLLQHADVDELHHARTELDKLLVDAINASRSLTIELSPPILHESGLVDCLRWLARHIQQQYRLDVDVQIDGDAAAIDPLVNNNMKIVLFESAREALLNVAKYAGVTEVALHLYHDTTGQMLELTVADDGAGFDVDKLALRGTGVERFGLFSIRERLELHDGQLVIDSAPGQGTRVMFRLPVAHSPAPAEHA